MVCVCLALAVNGCKHVCEKNDLYKVSARSGLTSIFFWYVLTCD